jgi:phage shock protein PspC (stress-responsive transcriptional regulator)
MEKKLERTRKPNKWIGGVAGGLGKFFGMDPIIWRLIFLLGTLFGFGSFILVYVVMWCVVPKELIISPIVESEKNI